MRCGWAGDAGEVVKVEMRLICGFGLLKDNGIEGFGVGTHKESDKESETGADLDNGHSSLLKLCAGDLNEKEQEFRWAAGTPRSAS